MPFGCHFELIFHGFICFLHTLLELHICIDFAWNFHEFRSLKFQCPIKYNPFECPIDLGEALFPSFTASTETASAISAGSMADAFSISGEKTEVSLVDGVVLKRDTVLESSLETPFSLTLC